MNAIDTNVLIYAIDLRDPRKHGIARQLLQDLRGRQAPTTIPWQVAGEFLKYLRDCQRRGEINSLGITRYLRVLRRLFVIVVPTEPVLDRALEIFDRYSLSHWDSMLLAACIESGVATLYTEDMGAPRTIDTLRLLNPFPA